MQSGRKRVKKQVTFHDALDKSRKHKLWLRLNIFATVGIIAFLTLTSMYVATDVRGEYTTYNTKLGMIRLSISHHDGQLFNDLSIPKWRSVMQCAVSDKDLGNNVEWGFVDVRTPNAPPRVRFKGKVEGGNVSGILQDGIELYPVTLEKNAISSVFRQVKGFLPGNSG